MGELDYEWCKTILLELISEGKLEVLDDDDGESDRAWCLEVISDWIIEAGDIAYRLYWDSGGPGAGADVECVYRFRGLYFQRSSAEWTLSGPFQSFDDVLDEEFLAITEATVSIDCDELAAEDIARRLTVYFGEDWEEASHVLMINGEKWRVAKDRTLELICLLP